MKYKYVSWKKDKYKGIVTFDGKVYHVGYSKELSERAEKFRLELEEKRLKDTLAICDEGEVFKDVPGCRGMLHFDRWMVEVCMVPKELLGTKDVVSSNRFFESK